MSTEEKQKKAIEDINKILEETGMRMVINQNIVVIPKEEKK